MARPTNTQFALAAHLLSYLGAVDAPQLASSEEMSGSTGASPVHVRRVLGLLREAGMVESRPGVGGGWRLLADPHETTLADVWRVVQRDDPVLGLHGANPDCPIGRDVHAALTQIDRRAARAIEDELATIRLADLEPSPAPA